MARALGVLFPLPGGKTRATCDIDCVEPLARLLEEHHGEIAALIVEPLLQGAGGMIVHPVEFLQRVAASSAPNTTCC